MNRNFIVVIMFFLGIATAVVATYYLTRAKDIAIMERSMAGIYYNNLREKMELLLAEKNNKYTPTLDCFNSMVDFRVKDLLGPRYQNLFDNRKLQDVYDDYIQKYPNRPAPVIDLGDSRGVSNF